LSGAPATSVRIGAGDAQVSGLWLAPQPVRACYVLAPGAGAGIRQASLEAIAAELGAHGIATLRYQFPYVERGSRRPDAPPICHATVRAAIAEAARLAPAVPLIAGGRSFGGRMTSQAQSIAPLAGVRGLAFLAFPLHPAGQPSETRATHLAKIEVPMLFLQGTRDALAELSLLRSVTARLGERATLHLLEGADHSFHVAARSGRTDAQVRSELVGALAEWVDGLIAPRP
jgi:predicted alpha/beta-hydrolase family hydrolase